LPQDYYGGDLPFLCDTPNSTFGHGLTIAPSYGTNASFTSTTRGGGWAWSLNGAGVYGADASINSADSLTGPIYYHLVHVFHRNGAGLTYLNGVLVDATTISAAGNILNASQCCVGQDPNGTYAETGSGDIDDLGVWRRSLSDAEARGIYVAATNGLSFVNANIEPTITHGPAPGQVTITWAAGTLQQASSVAGPYADVPGPPSSPYTITAAAPTYFRVRYPNGQ